MQREKDIGYVAGSLFSDSDIRQRKYEAEKLREVRPEVNWYNPIEAPCNDKSLLPTSQDIFNGDTIKILSSKYLIYDLSNNDDPGMMVELGITWMCNYMHKLFEQGLTIEEIKQLIPKKKVYFHLSDIRLATANKYTDIHIPVGFNQYELACAEQLGKIYPHFEDIIKDIKNE
jgi:hypothetical protein